MDKRSKKRHSVHDVSQMCGVAEYVIRDYEKGVLGCVDFTTWLSLATYYGRDMMKILFYIHSLERAIAEVYFMHLRENEPVQYAAKMAMEEMRRSKC